MSVAERGMAFGLRALRGVAGLELIDRLGLRAQVEGVVFRATRQGFRTAGAASRTFASARGAVQGGAKPYRLPSAGRGGLFDVTPDDEQEMLAAAMRDVAAERLRPAALAADDACQTPAELLELIAELGVGTLGVPEALGGAVSERSAVTTVLVAEALAHGDLGIAAAALAPGAVASAISLWGDAEQQARYLPAFVGEDPPAAALALLEPRPLFDPTRLECRASSLVLNGEKSLVPLAASAELFLVAARLDAHAQRATPSGARAPSGARVPSGAQAGGPALLLVPSDAPGVTVAPEPAMGLRAAATGSVRFENVQLAPDAVLGGEPDPGIYSECIARARLGWCAASVGCARAVHDYVIPYVNERVAFGEPISHRQAVAFAVAEIAVELEGMRLLTLRAASLADQGKPFAHHAALARILCAAKGAEIGSQGVQLLGGHGYVKEHPVERWYRDLQAAGLMEGALLA